MINRRQDSNKHYQILSICATRSPGAPSPLILKQVTIELLPPTAYKRAPRISIAAELDPIPFAFCRQNPLRNEGNPPANILPLKCGPRIVLKSNQMPHSVYFQTIPLCLPQNGRLLELCLTAESTHPPHSSRGITAKQGVIRGAIRTTHRTPSKLPSYRHDR